MDAGSKGLLALGFVFLSIFLGMAITLYELKNNNIRLRDNIAKVEKKLEEKNVSDQLFRALVENSFSSVREDVEISNKKISVLDRSIDSKGKRLANIKRVREVISSTTSESVPILELTSMAASVVDYSEEYDIPIPLVLAVIKRESNFNKKAVSKANAQGLMQLLPETAAEVANDVNKRHYSLFNIKNNIQFGTFYLRKMLDTFNGEEELAIRAYNCGPTYVERVNAGEYKKYPEETVEYLKSVLRWKSVYENEGL
jgi:soluble lytic murein transglycosylase-like protein